VKDGQADHQKMLQKASFASDGMSWHPQPAFEPVNIFVSTKKSPPNFDAKEPGRLQVAQRQKLLKTGARTFKIATQIANPIYN
jgi:hypothetical protein